LLVLSAGTVVILRNSVKNVTRNPVLLIVANVMIVEILEQDVLDAIITTLVMVMLMVNARIVLILYAQDVITHLKRDKSNWVNVTIAEKSLAKNVGTKFVLIYLRVVNAIPVYKLNAQSVV
jgi:hypothetical protein